MNHETDLGNAIEYVRVVDIYFPGVKPKSGDVCIIPTSPYESGAGARKNLRMSAVIMFDNPMWREGGSTEHYNYWTNLGVAKHMDGVPYTFDEVMPSPAADAVDQALGKGCKGLYYTAPAIGQEPTQHRPSKRRASAESVEESVPFDVGFFEQGHESGQQQPPAKVNCLAAATFDAVVGYFDRGVADSDALCQVLCNAQSFVRFANPFSRYQTIGDMRGALDRLKWLHPRLVALLLPANKIRDRFDLMLGLNATKNRKAVFRQRSRCVVLFSVYQGESRFDHSASFVSGSAATYGTWSDQSLCCGLNTGSFVFEEHDVVDAKTAHKVMLGIYKASRLVVNSVYVLKFSGWDK